METFDIPQTDAQLSLLVLERSVLSVQEDLRALVQEYKTVAQCHVALKEDQRKHFGKMFEMLESLVVDVSHNGHNGHNGGGGRNSAHLDGSQGGSQRRIRLPDDSQPSAGSPSPTAVVHVHSHPRLTPQATTIASPELCSTGSDGQMSSPSHRRAPAILKGNSKASKSRQRRSSTLSAALPMTWPESVEMRQVYANEPALDGQSLLLMAEANRQTIAENSSEAGKPSKSMLIEGSAAEPKREPKNRFILHPTSGARLFVDVVSLFVLAYDLIVTPYVLAFNVQSHEPFVSGGFATLIFWTASIFINFRSGFYKNGTALIKPREIAWHYIKTWFAPDLFLVITDWISMAALIFGEIGSSDGKYAAAFTLLRFSKAGRLLRLLGIFRMARFTSVMIRIADRCLTSTAKSMIETLGFVFALLWVNHLISCAWVSLDSLELKGDTGLHWTDASILPGLDERTYSETKDAYKYFTALHWSLTQMSPGSMQINPLNTVERFFTVLCLILGILCSGSIVSTLTAKMMQMMMANQDRMRKINVLRRFLRQKSVNARLALDIQKMVTDRMQAVRPLTPSDVSALTLLSLSLRGELQEELTKVHITKYAFFRAVEQLDSITLKGLCSSALDFIVLPTNDNLFLAGSDATDTYLVMAGILEYTQEPATSMVHETTKSDVETGQWLCETALWTVWTHVGTVEAMTMSEMMVISVEKVILALQRHQVIKALSAEYCRSYLSRLVTACPPIGDWPNDLYVPFTDWGEMVLSMFREARIILGLSALDAVRSSRKGRFTFPEKAAQRLEEELYTGQSALILAAGASDSLERIVGVAALRIQDDEDRVLAQVGIYDPENGTIQAKCCLPGTKLQEHETPAEALRNRVLGDELASLSEKVVVTRFVKEVEKVVSEQYRVPTKYLRTKYDARWIAGSFDLSESGVVFWEAEESNNLVPESGPVRAISRPGGQMTPSGMTPSERESGFLGRRGSERRPSQESRGMILGEMPTSGNAIPKPQTLFALMNNEMKLRVFAWLDERCFRLWTSHNGKANLEAFLMSKTIREEHVHAARELQSNTMLAMARGAVHQTTSDEDLLSDGMAAAESALAADQLFLVERGLPMSAASSAHPSERQGDFQSELPAVEGHNGFVFSRGAALTAAGQSHYLKAFGTMEPLEAFVSLHV